MTAYQFVIVKYMQSTSAGELLNVGVVMWLPERRRLLKRMNERFGRLSRCFKGFDGAGYRQMVRDLERRCEEIAAELIGGDIFQDRPRSIEEILLRVLPVDASCLQRSPVMAGVTPDPDARLGQLFAEMVERHEPGGPRERRDEAQIWTSVEQRLVLRGLNERVRRGVEISGPNLSYRFKIGWTNGVTQVLEPVSLDHLSEPDLIGKALTWSGRLYNLAEGADFQWTGVVALPQRTDLAEAGQRAVAMLRAARNVRAVIPEDEIDSFLPVVERDLSGREAASQGTSP